VALQDELGAARARIEELEARLGERAGSRNGDGPDR
jgi:hypothetical protein